MIYLLISKILLGLGVASYLYSLYSRYQSAQIKIARAEAQAKIQSDLETIAQKAKVSDEKVVDFNDAVNKFNTDSDKPSAS